MSRATHGIWKTLTAARELIAGPSQVRPGLRILCYHSVGPALPGDPYGLAIAPEAFRAQMELIASGRFGIPTTLGSARIDGATTEIAITFDDGFLDTARTAAPILAALNLPFTVNVTADFIRGAVSPHMSVSDLKLLATQSGVEIGAHGVSHVHLDQCDDATLERELSQSKKFIEATLSKPVRVMTWPHGSASRRTALAASRLGYARAGCSLYGSNGPERNPLLLRRVEITGFDSLRDFERKASGAWDWYALRQTDPDA